MRESFDTDAQKLFGMIRKFSDISREIEAVFKKYELTSEEKLLVLSVIVEEYMDKDGNIKK